MSKFVPLSIPNFEGNEVKFVDDAVSQGWVSTGGAYITELEEKLAEYLHVDEVSACQSGTSALHLALIETGVGPGDMVIVPTLTFIAAVNPVRYQFADPIFMDCDDSLCMDPVKLRKFCAEECQLVDVADATDSKIHGKEFNSKKLVHKASGKTVKAVVVVHVFGNLADMNEITQIAAQYHLTVIEDATEALGSHYIEGPLAGRYAGTIGDFGAYSFNGNKIITTGGGGAMVAKAPGETAHLRYLSTQAKDDPHYYIHNEIGYNYRMTNVQAAIGVAQMEELAEFVGRKQRNYEYYKGLLKDFPYGKLLPFREGTLSNKWFYSLELPVDRMDCELRTIITELQEAGVQTRAIWGLIHEQLPYKDALVYEMEKAPYYSSCILNFPSTTQITKEDMDYVVEQMGEVLGAHIH